jgi:hypothetical protein
LDSESTVGVNITRIIYPRNSELDKALGLDDTLDNTGIDIFGVGFKDRF